MSQNPIKQECYTIFPTSFRKQNYELAQLKWETGNEKKEENKTIGIPLVASKKAYNKIEKFNNQ